MKRPVFVLFLLSLLLTGCVNLQNVPIPNTGERISDTSKSRIYVIRPEQGFMGLFGSQSLQEIFENYRSIGILPVGEYLVWETEPGMKTITPARPKDVITMPNSGRPVSIEAKAGEVYFFALVIHQGTFILSRLSESDGRKLLTETTRPGQ